MVVEINVANGIGEPVPTGTSGSVLFIDGNSNLGQDNTNFNRNVSTKLLTQNGAVVVTNALTSGTPGTASQINTGDPNTVGLIVKGNTNTPAGVQPDTVSGLIFWIKQDTLALNDGDLVSSWTDSSTSGANATASGTGRPTYKTNIIGGKPAVLFDGSANFMTGALTITGTNKLTAFMVMQNVSQTGGGSFSISRSGVADSNDVNVAIVNYNNNGTDSMFYKFNPGGTVTNPSNGTSFIYTAIDSGASSTNYMNGTAGSAVAVDATNWNVGLYYLGSRYSGAAANGFAHCYISETILYNTNLSATDRNNVLAYLSNKYGISVSGISTAQTSDLAQIQSSAGTVLTSIDSGGNLKLNTVGQTIYVKEGTNAKAGIAVLIGGTVTVSTTAVTANSRIYLTVNTAGGTVGSPYVSARTAGTSFAITSTSNTDTSTVAWLIVEPA